MPNVYERAALKKKKKKKLLIVVKKNQTVVFVFKGPLEDLGPYVGILKIVEINNWAVAGSSFINVFVLKTFVYFTAVITYK